PALERVGGVVLLGAGLARPGPARAHLVPLDGTPFAGLLVQPPEGGEDLLLADLPLRGLHELEDADRPALVPPPEGQPEGGGGLALPGAATPPSSWSTARGEWRRWRVVSPSSGVTGVFPWAIRRRSFG